MTWTPVDDGMPPFSVPVLVETVYHDKCVATMEPWGGWQLVSCGAMVEDRGIDSVYRWMYIPEAD